MPIPGAFIVTFSGPKEAEDNFIAALRSDGLAAECCQPMYPEETRLSWVRVLTHEGHDGHPSDRFQQRVNASADGIANVFGFSHRAHDPVIGSSFPSAS
jgi:hypothetical protein